MKEIAELTRGPLQLILYSEIRIRIGQIRIRIGNADPDPRAGKQTKINIKITWFPAFQKGFCTFVGMFFDLLPDRLQVRYVPLFFMQKFNLCDFKV
jgi:hypothetical protein